MICAVLQQEPHYALTPDNMTPGNHHSIAVRYAQQWEPDFIHALRIDITNIFGDSIWAVHNLSVQVIRKIDRDAWLVRTRMAVAFGRPHAQETDLVIHLRKVGTDRYEVAVMSPYTWSLRRPC